MLGQFTDDGMRVEPKRQLGGKDETLIRVARASLPKRPEVVCNSAEAHLLRRVKSHKAVATIPKPAPTRQTPCHPE